MTSPSQIATQTRAIAMWDFSWLERRWNGGGFHDWEAALDGLVERGYDVVRIDVYPHLIAADPERSWDLIPVWPQHHWGSPSLLSVRPLPALLEFLTLAKDRGILVSLSSWFREDSENVRLGLNTPRKLAEVWNTTLRHIQEAGLLDTVWFVDLCNEWMQSAWAPFVFHAESTHALSISRTSKQYERWTSEALEGVREKFDLPLCFSFSDQFDDCLQEDVSGFDLLEPHIWMAQESADQFYATLEYDLNNSNFDAHQYKILENAQALYEADTVRWQTQLAQKIDAMAEWSTSTQLPLVTSEGWAVVTWKDSPNLDWTWIKDLNAFAVDRALRHHRWIAIATSNFCSPQFTGMWDDIPWHREMTTKIRSSTPDIGLPALTPLLKA